MNRHEKKSNSNSRPFRKKMTSDGREGEKGHEERAASISATKKKEYLRHEKKKVNSVGLKSGRPKEYGKGPSCFSQPG